MNIPFDGLATFFIFLIGIPAFVIENQKSELRRVVLRRRHTLYRRTGQWILAALVVIAIGVALDVGLERLTATSDEFNLPFQWNGKPHYPNEAYLWLVVFALLVGISILATARFLKRYGGYRGILEDLHKEISKPLRAHADAVPFLQSDVLEELIELGRQSDAGQDKDQVLQEIFRLVRATCKHPKYRGDSLENVTRGLVLLVGADPKVGSSQNFETAAKILEHILTSKQLRSQEHRSDDISYSIRVASQLGRQATRQLKSQIEVEATLTVYLETLDLAADKYPKSLTDVSQALYELGSAALDEAQTLTAMGALNKLIVLFENTNPPQNELTADVLALMAHFWDNGDTARMFVHQHLEPVKDLLQPSLPDALSQAQTHCAVTSRFHTADLIAKMTRELQAASLAATH